MQTSYFQSSNFLVTCIQKLMNIHVWFDESVSFNELALEFKF